MMKKIVVNDCLECPIIAACKEVKKLPKKARVAMTISTACYGVLKTCPLEDN